MSMSDIHPRARTFKTAAFAKAARKARISDDELCSAVVDVAKGQADDLGGGVYKKRLDKNRHRSIILAKFGFYWLFQYLYAKNERANINDDELAEFRLLAKKLQSTKDEHIAPLLADGRLTEICNDQVEI